MEESRIRTIKWIRGANLWLAEGVVIQVTCKTSECLGKVLKDAMGQGMGKN